MPTKKQKQINLLGREDFENTNLGKALKWTLSAGRVIIILTELVVIGAFLSRFWLDRKLNDLIEENTIRKIQVQAQAPFEESFREDQAKIQAYKKLNPPKTHHAEVVSTLAALLPAGVSLTEISILENDLSLKGISISEGGIAGVLKTLENSTMFENATLVDVSLETGQQTLNFTITGNIKEEKNGN